MNTKAGTYNLNLFGDSSVKRKAIIVGVFLVLSAIYAYSSDYNLATGTGNLSMVLFLAANVYFPAKRIRLHYRFKDVQPAFNSLLVYHIWLNTAAFIVACIHCYVRVSRIRSTLSDASRTLGVNVSSMGMFGTDAVSVGCTGSAGSVSESGSEGAGG